ncbi:hypothetical protein GCM10010329_60750 [Streptomyces spiroverticillatus]|uniref:Uncharacterized protein n=1 Tax=Streptomyces finlayi TaxID=67296 RepID=A0A919CD85_9ACTN|nr:hypothetical protein [Streptomyces finlayi]GHA29277.1 hypothetical protein GCM10010329_60750 [Streptomyces spiroverticillatus]GHD09762.1 hypothetical protein GCM10010334_64410 [Streptomyces finlayi]
MFTRRRDKEKQGSSAALRRTVLAAAGALLLVAALPSSAGAAGGQFTFSRNDGSVDALFAPPNDVCLPLSGGAAHASNDTDATAFVFLDGGCSQLSAIVGVGGTWDQYNPPPQPAYSVRFGSSG